MFISFLILCCMGLLLNAASRQEGGAGDLPSTPSPDNYFGSPFKQAL